MKAMKPMKKARGWSPGPVTAALAVLLVLAMAGLDASRFWDLSFGRSGAIARAREVAAAFGLDASRWKVRVRAEPQDRIRRFREVKGAAGTAIDASALAPILYSVQLEDPSTDDRLEIRLDGRGGLHRFSLRPFRPSVDAADENPRTAAGKVADQALEALVDPGSSIDGSTREWELIEDREMGESGWRFLWQQAAPEGHGIRWQAEVTVRGGFAHDFEVEPILEVVPSRRNHAEDLQGLVNLLLLLAALVYGLQSHRYRHPHRNVVSFGVLTLLVGTVATLVRSGPLPSGIGSMLAGALSALLDPILLRALGAALLFGAGCAVGRRWFPEALAPLETLLTREWRARSVARSVAWGIPSGLLVAILPALVVFLTRAKGGSGGALLVAADGASVTARLPFLEALMPRMDLAVLGYFGLLLPLAAGLFRRPGLARVLAVPLAVLLLAPLVPVEGEPMVILGVTLLVVAALDQIYRRWGLLAVLVAAWAGAAAARGASLAVQPGILRLSGVLTLAFLAGAAYGASALARRPEAFEGLLPSSLPLAQRLRAERERIKAQLGVAQEAQARMLPAAPPEIPGWSIAAVCRPAREVGGDLYDFLQGPDGRLGILVGDVSGKGMVASLYMTLTKGLVLATFEETQAPAEVLVAVNEGLHQETERGVFVTAWLGRLDPRTGRLEHARAGHNPLLWRRARLGETVALTPRGLPLGAIGNHMFAPSLDQEDLLIEPGDALFIYSDGLSEAMDTQRNEYGEERLIATIGRTDGLSADRARDILMADVDAFVGSADQHDDMTLLVLRFEPSAES